MDIEAILAGILLAFPLGGIWASYKLYKWQRFYGTRFLWGLFIASVAADVAAIPVAFLSARRIFLGPDAPSFPEAGAILGFALIVLEGVFIYLVHRWRDLDVDMQRIREGDEDESRGTNLAPEEDR